MSTTVRTFHVCDRCARDVVLVGSRAESIPVGWMEVRGQMFDKDGDSTGVKFHALLCPQCRSALEDWRDELATR